MIHKSLFFSKYLDKKIKVLIYQVLVRPILVYGCRIWFNISLSMMEKIRGFESKCLRTCTKLHRSAESDFLKYISNKRLYNESEIIRIDNFIVQLIRSHIRKRTINYDNSLIYCLFYSEYKYTKKSLDKLGFIQNEDGTPIFYHNFRKARDKSIKYVETDLVDFRFSTSISDHDIDSIQSLRITNYWWL